MSTCVRDGQTYRRHWYNEESVCMRCNRESAWAVQNREQNQNQVVVEEEKVVETQV